MRAASVSGSSELRGLGGEALRRARRRGLALVGERVACARRRPSRSSAAESRGCSRPPRGRRRAGEVALASWPLGEPLEREAAERRVARGAPRRPASRPRARRRGCAELLAQVPGLDPGLDRGRACPSCAAATSAKRRGVRPRAPCARSPRSRAPRTVVAPAGAPIAFRKPSRTSATASALATLAALVPPAREATTPPARAGCRAPIRNADRVLAHPARGAVEGPLDVGTATSREIVVRSARHVGSAPRARPARGRRERAECISGRPPLPSRLPRRARSRSRTGTPSKPKRSRSRFSRKRR